MAGSVRVAAIDCGTNSMRLLIADFDPYTRRLRDLSRQMEVTRLGQGVDRTGQFAPEALDRTLQVLRRYGQACRQAQVEKLKVVATSAARDAANRDVFLDGVKRELGVEAEVIDGLEEASLSFLGARTGLPSSLPGPYLCVDLGGGSTELALGQQKAEFVYSVDVGCVRVTERYLRSDPPTAAAVQAAMHDVDRLLDRALQHVPLGRTGSLIGLGGSITTITAHALSLTEYDPQRIDGACLSVDQILVSCRQLWELSVSARRRLGFMHPGRADVIGGGALVWACVLERLRSEVLQAGGLLDRVVTAEHDILDGIALTAALADS